MSLICLKGLTHGKHFPSLNEIHIRTSKFCNVGNVSTQLVTERFDRLSLVLSNVYFILLVI